MNAVDVADQFIANIHRHMKVRQGQGKKGVNPLVYVHMLRNFEEFFFKQQKVKQAHIILGVDLDQPGHWTWVVFFQPKNL